jgi:hypothetical protein
MHVKIRTIVIPPFSGAHACPRKGVAPSTGTVVAETDGYSVYLGSQIEPSTTLIFSRASGVI